MFKLFSTFLVALATSITGFSQEEYTVTITGPATASTGQTKTYNVEWRNSNFQLVAPPPDGDYFWNVMGGTVTTQTSTSCNISWTAAGTRTVSYEYLSFDNYYFDSHSVVVSSGGPPSTPNTTFTITQNCGSTLVARNTNPPAGIQWYWQTSSTGTSTTLGYNSSIARTTTGYLYLRARTANSPYTWSTSSQTAGNISIVITPPSVPATATNGDIISNTGGLVNVSVGPVSGATSYQWFTVPTGGSAISGVSGTSYSPTVQQTQSYFIQSMIGACASTTRKEVIVRVHPEPSITSTHNGRVSMGTATTLSLNYPYDSYQWKKDGAIISGATGSTHTTNQPGSYTVRVTKGAAPLNESPSSNVTAGPTGQNLNYIVSNTMLKAGVTETDIDTLSVKSMSQSIQYFDGLGRAIQTVTTQGSPSKKDIVQPIVYDAFGREHRKYLPIVPNASDGWYKTGLIDATTGNYTIPFNDPAKISDYTKPFSETIFEASPLNRVLEQGAPGTTWQPDATHSYTSPDYTVKKAYEFNTTGEVLLWTYTYPTSTLPLGLVNAGTAASPTHYAANQLYKNKTKDEQGHEVIEYVDKQGKTVLKRVQAKPGTLPVNDSTYASTYYIYDDFGSLVCVIPPEATKRIIQTNPASEYFDKIDSDKDAFLKRWAFRYTYDGRKRMAQKQVPGAEPVYMVYDNRDRLVLTQDGNQRTGAPNTIKYWAFTKYDELNRPILTGIKDTTISLATVHLTQEQMQGVVDAYYAAIPTKPWRKYGETFKGTTGVAHGYSNASYPAVTSGSVLDVQKYLTATYYDNYNFKSMVSGLNYINNDLLPGQLTTEFTRVQGQVTGTKVKILGTSNYLYSVTYFDDKYRAIQTITQNHKSGSDRVTNKFDFIGKVLETKRTYLVSGVTRTIKETFTYDHAGRLLTIKHNTNGTGDIMIAKNEYNELGQLVDKKLHATSVDNYTAFKQSIDYRYNIRGWLSSVNNSQLSVNSSNNDDVNDLFGFELGYTTDLGLGATPQYNGNIAAMKWSNNTIESNVLQRGYALSYDPLNRLKAANQKQAIVFDTWAAGNYDENGLDYDLNGNIKALQRKDGTGATIDNLTYNYGTGSTASNKLQYVNDAANATKGFVNGNTGVDDYAYDLNGNLITDKNKGITAIAYNHLNLPNQVNRGASDYIVYTYDATGRKLSQQVFGATPKTTDYVGELIFENNVLKFINQSEGRVLPDGSTWEYQYHLKDHLGNVRTTFSVKGITDTKTATLETANATAEQGQFLRFAEVRKIQSFLFDHTNGTAPTTTTGYAQRLNGSTNEKYGLAKSISVMPGDIVTTEVYAKYIDQNSSNWTTALNTLLSQIAAGTAAPGTVVDGSNFTNSTSSFQFPAAAAQNTANSSEAGPKAYLNWLVFKKDGTFMLSQSGYDRLSIAPKEYGQDVAHERLYSPNITITEAGFVYIYLSNEEGTPLEVYFDDFKVTHVINTPVMQTDDYYPFGLTFNSYSRENSTPNQYKFNSKEEQDELSLGWLDYGARMYMPELGRWGVIDPLSEKMRRWSPYNYAYDNPIRFIDADGMKPSPSEAARIAKHAYGNDDVKLKGGWKVSEREFKGVTLSDKKTGLQSQVYERTIQKGKDKGKVEYVYATAGTNPKETGDLVADATQAIATSAQYDQSVDNAKKISDQLGETNSELTFTGHSLGGGEAAANALATGKDAITFNAAGLSNASILKYNGLKNLFVSKIDAYVMKTDPLNYAQDRSSMMPDVNGTRHNVNPASLGAIFNGHSIDHMITALEKEPDDK